MAASQVILYFDRQEDAVRFTLAASSVISTNSPVRSDEAVVEVAKEICKASRITTEGALNSVKRRIGDNSGSAEKACA